MEIKYYVGRKHCEKRRNWLVTSNFSFSYIVLPSYISLVRQNVVLCGNGLNVIVLKYPRCLQRLFP